MATFDVDLTANEGYGIAWPTHRLGVLRRRVDFTVAANQLAQNKIMGVFKIPADCVVLKYGIKVITVDADIDTTAYLGVYTQTAAGVITDVDYDGFAVTGQVLTTAGYVAPDPDAAFNSAGADYLHPMAANSVLSFTNTDTATINDAVVDFFAIVLDVSKPTGTTMGGTGSFTT